MFEHSKEGCVKTTSKTGVVDGAILERCLALFCYLNIAIKPAGKANLSQDNTDVFSILRFSSKETGLSMK
jgi:hypothetical protein